MKIPQKIIESAKRLAGIIGEHNSKGIRAPNKKLLVVAKKYGFNKTAEGAARRTYISPEWVLKVDKYGEEVKEDFDFIKRFKQRIASIHFPVTRCIENNVLIQEKVEGIGDYKGEITYRVANFAEDQFGIGDMHEENFGWKLYKGIFHPIFVDVDHVYDYDKNVNTSWIEYIADELEQEKKDKQEQEVAAKMMLLKKKEDARRKKLLAKLSSNLW